MATENNAQMLISIDEYLSGIRDAFDRLAQELEVTQKQRDEYKETVEEQAKQLRKYETKIPRPTRFPPVPRPVPNRANTRSSFQRVTSPPSPIPEGIVEFNTARSPPVQPVPTRANTRSSFPQTSGTSSPRVTSEEIGDFNTARSPPVPRRVPTSTNTTSNFFREDGFSPSTSPKPIHANETDTFNTARSPPVRPVPTRTNTRSTTFFQQDGIPISTSPQPIHANEIGDFNTARSPPVPRRVPTRMNTVFEQDGLLRSTSPKPTHANERYGEIDDFNTAPVPRRVPTRMNTVVQQVVSPPLNNSSMPTQRYEEIDDFNTARSPPVPRRAPTRMNTQQVISPPTQRYDEIDDFNTVRSSPAPRRVPTRMNTQQVVSPPLTANERYDETDDFDTTRSQPVPRRVPTRMNTVFQQDGLLRSTSSIPTHANERYDEFVTFNPEVKCELEVTFVNAFTHQPGVCDAMFSPDGRHIAVASLKGSELAVFDVESWSKKFVLRDSLSQKSQIFCVCFSRDGRYLAAGGRAILIWEFGTAHMRKILRGHTDTIHCLDFSPDGRRIVSASCDNTVRVWNLRDGSSTIVGDQDGSYWTCCFSPNGECVAASTRYLTKLWDIRTLRLIRDFSGDESHLTSLSFTLDGMGLVSGSRDTTLKRWDASSISDVILDSRQSRCATRHDECRELVNLCFEGHTRAVNSVSMSPNGRWILSGSDDNTAGIWDAHTAKWHCMLGHGRRVLSVGFSPVGNRLFIGDEGQLSVWEYTRIHGHGVPER